MNKIKKLSQIAQWILLAIMIILPTSLILFWINAPAPLLSSAANYGIDIKYLPDGLKILHTLTAGEKWIGFIINLLPVGITFIICCLLYKLFNQFKQLAIFSLQNVKYLRRIGYLIIIGELIISPIYQALITGTMTYHNPRGHGVISISFSGYNLALVTAGVLILLVSWIMAEGYRLNEEQKYII